MRSEARDLLTHCTHAPTSLREVRDPLSAGSPTLSSPTQWWERAGRVRGWEQAVAAAGRRLGDLAGPAHPDGCPQRAARSWRSPPTGASARRPHATCAGCSWSTLARSWRGSRRPTRPAEMARNRTSVSMAKRCSGPWRVSRTGVSKTQAIGSCRRWDVVLGRDKTNSSTATVARPSSGRRRVAAHAVARQPGARVMCGAYPRRA